MDARDSSDAGVDEEVALLSRRLRLRLRRLSRDELRALSRDVQVERIRREGHDPVVDGPIARG